MCLQWLSFTAVKLHLFLNVVTELCSGANAFGDKPLSTHAVSRNYLTLHRRNTAGYPTDISGYVFDGARCTPEAPLRPAQRVRVATDPALRASRCSVLSLGRGIAATMVALRHSWLILSVMSDRKPLIWTSLSPGGLFG